MEPGCDTGVLEASTLANAPKRKMPSDAPDED